MSDDALALVKESWTRIENRIAEYSECVSQLSPGATSFELKMLEEKIQIDLPEEVKYSLAIHNGDKCTEDAIAAAALAKKNGNKDFDVKVVLFAGLQLISVDEIFNSWNDWREVEAALDDSANIGFKSIPEGAIQSSLTNCG